MATNSKYHRYREAGEAANVNNVERFGTAPRSLFTSSKVFSIHHKIEITDEAGNVAYRAESKAVSIHDKTEVYDASGAHVSHIEKKLFTLHERHFITMEDGTSFQLSNELFHLVKDITNIEGLGWQMRGNVIGLNFELYDENGGIIAVIAQKAFSLHDKYCIDIYKPQYERIVVSILIALQHMIKNREAVSASSASFSSSGN